MIDLWSLQQAVYSALTAAPGPYPIFDAVPQGVGAPYIVIGEFYNETDSDLGANSSDATLTLHGWSRHQGKQEAHAILAFIRDRLDHQSVGGAWAFFADQEDIFEDRSSTADSRLYHAVARYRIRTN